MHKQNLSDESDVRAKVLSGARKMNELVSKTLGPNGQTVIIDRGGPEPLLVDDGRRVAENIKLDDPLEQMTVRTIYGVTRKTDEKVGDGTTTAMVLTHAIVDEVARNYISPGGVGGMSVAEVDRQLQASKDRVVTALRKMAKPVKTEADLVSVASVVSGDPEIGKMIGGMYHQLGKDGHISLEFNLISEQLETEVVSGYRFSGGYAANWMISDALRRVCIIDDVHVLVADRSKEKDIEWNHIIPLMQQVAESGRKSLVIVARRFSPAFLQMAYKQATLKQGAFFVVCVRAPSRGEEAYKDMGIFTGGKVFTDADAIEEALLADVGRVKRIELSEDTCILIEGTGKPEAIAKRVKEAQAEAALQKLPQLKADRLERASALSGGVGLIKIGAPTDEERNWLKYKIEDAKHATKHAYREGIVPGAGQAFMQIAENMDENDILKNVLLAPYNTLKRNAKGAFKVPKGVFDPVAVEIAALENAVSAASKLIRIGAAVVFAPTPTLDQAFKAVLGKEGADLIQDDNDE